MKKIIALALALTMLAVIVTGCTKIKVSESDPNGNGAVIDVYMGTKTINLDPATAYTDENSVKILSLIFEGLFKLDKSGNVSKALATRYEFGTDREGNKMLSIWIGDTYWSDGSLVQANDIVYAWKRILDPDFASGAAPLLYAIKGAKDAKEGYIGIDDIGLYASSATKLVVIFEEGADTDQFIYNLASPALVPLRENKVDPYKNTWSYSSQDLATNGPFRVKKFTGVSSDGQVNTTDSVILERSSYYYLKQDIHTEDKDKYVYPYRIILHYEEPLDFDVVATTSKAEKDIVTMFADKELFYVSNLTLETTYNFKKSQIKYDKLASTYSYVFNYDNPLFANAAVRQALSIALDRAYAASDLVGTGHEAATGLIPSMIFDTAKGSKFRSHAGKVISSAADLDAAKELIAKSGINPATYDIELIYRKDEANDSYGSISYSKEKALAVYAEEVWESLGFTVTRREYNAKQYEDALKSKSYDIIGLDLQMLSPFAIYDLAQFATQYSGSVDTSAFNEDGGYKNVPGIYGYSSEEYDALIDEAFSATKKKEKAQLLYAAERILVDDAAVIPVLFNSDCYVVSSELSGLTTNYFGAKMFTKAVLKNYDRYLLAPIPSKKDEDVI